MTEIRLSKSKILSGLQCDKRLWLEINEPEARGEDAALEARLQAGTDVGVIARKEWPDGILASEDDYGQAVKDTEAWLADPVRPLFEGMFMHEGVRIRPDALVPNGDGSIDLYEVKSSTSVKPYHESDVSVQAWVLRGLGVNLRRVYLTHINNEFVYPGDGDYRGLFTHADLTEVAAANAAAVEAWVSRFLTVLSSTKPDIGIGPHCSDPFDCPFWDHCAGAQPEYPVSLLPRGRELIGELQEAGFHDLREVPAERLTSDNHRRIHQATVTGKPIANSEAGRTLRVLGWPRYYLDFETVMFPVPIWKGTRPWQNLPFQWSCHVEHRDGTLEHHEFLADPDEWPFRKFARTLVSALGLEGPVFVYNAGFEKRMMRTAGGLAPYLAKSLDLIAERIVDLWPLTTISWYHPAQKGSWSLKAVLPTIAPDLDYHALEGVTHGGEAAEAIAEYCHPDTDEARRAAIANALRAYCKLDTLALVRLAKHLEALT